MNLKFSPTQHIVHQKLVTCVILVEKCC